MRFLRIVFNKFLKVIDYTPDFPKGYLAPITASLLKFLSFFPERIVFPFRFLLARFFPWNPLNQSRNNAYDIFILVTAKDFEILPHSLASVMETIAGEFSQIVLVSPENSIEELQLRLHTFLPTADVRIVSDEKLLESLGVSRASLPNSHLAMQLIKFACALESTKLHSLVLDGDTIFLRNRNWAQDNYLTLVVPPEYQLLHVNFVRSYFPEIEHSKLGFTTQSQLIDKASLQDLIETCGGIHIFVHRFVQAMQSWLNDHTLNVYPCEWQVYGDWLVFSQPKRIRFSSYLNMNMSRSAFISLQQKNTSFQDTGNLLAFLRKSFPKIGTITLHHHTL